MKTLIATLIVRVMLVIMMVIAAPATSFAADSCDYASHFLVGFEAKLKDVIDSCSIWNQITKPKNVREFVRDIYSLNYRYDPPLMDILYTPQRTKMYGGDCEDLACYVFMRATQLNIGKKRGILLIGAFPPHHYSIPSHLVAIIGDGNRILVIDAACPRGWGRIYEISAYIKLIRRIAPAYQCWQIWWLGLPKEKQANTIFFQYRGK